MNTFYVTEQIEKISASQAFQSIEVSCVALMFNLLLYVIIKVQQVRQQQGRSVFSSVLFSVMAANMITCLQVFLTYVNLPVPLTVICALQALAFMANTMVCYYISYYMQRYFNRSTRDEKPLPLFNRCMVVAQGVILALWLLFAIPYILREGVLIRQDGILFFVTGFVMELYHLIYALYLFLLRRESSDSRSRLIVIFSFLLTISSIVVQAFIGETPMINYLGGTFALFVFYFNAETPDYIKLSRTLDELMVERQRAEAANVAKTEFLANMSHEMRTPLNAVLGMNEMILRQSKDAEITEYAGGIERAGQSLLSVINDVIDFSRIESGKMQINLAPYMLSAVIGDVCNMFVFRTEKSGLLFRMEVDPAIPDCLYGDETRVRQIMTNLLNNAVKYTREGHVTLRVGEEKLPEEGEEQNTCLVISVSDTGIGIKPEDMGRLFTKFERLDMDRNSTIEGTGLGLVITKQIVDLMKGTVTVESAYGEGSTFEVRIPQKVLDPIPIGDFKERFRKMYEGGSRKLTPFTAQKARVLVVDDTEINLTVFKKLLNRNRLVVDTASSGLEALRYTQDTVYDVIFMDQRMPGMDGATTFAHIRSQNNGANKETPVICLTADAVFGARERYLDIGFTDYLSKPIDLEKLETVLLEYIPQEKIVRGDDAVLEIAEQKTPPQQEQAPEEKTTLDEQTLHNLFTMSGVLSFRAAIRNCVDVDTLLVILKEYYDTIPENLEMLNRFLAESDMKNYNIKVHALKSSSRMIGALDFAEDAFRLEQCSAEGKEEMVWELTPAFIRKYGEIRDALRTIMEKA